MDGSKKELLKRYKQCIRRVEREGDIIDRARDRKNYWQNQSKIIESKLELVQNGQLEFSFNQTKERSNENQ